MKKIEVFQENVDRVELFDLDDSDIFEYVKSLSSLLELSKVSVLHTTSASLILRPSKVVSFLVSEVEKDVEEVKEEVVTDKKSVISEERVDTIIDG